MPAIFFPSCASIFNIFFLRTVFAQISPGIVEAARIDGAGHWKILWKVVAPMSVSSFVTLGLLSFLGSYNSFMWPSLLIHDKEKIPGEHGTAGILYIRGCLWIKVGNYYGSMLCDRISIVVTVLFRTTLDFKRNYQ